jgi:hypothetical protein
VLDRVAAQHEVQGRLRVFGEVKEDARDLG